ncbi:MAG: co-chaperone DjlA [Legionellales bacterium]|nr:MAG: co-chaperone DjlA [Legionellales bacterium]
MYWGKLAGIILGFVLFRALGAAIGLVVGHMFDYGLQSSMRPKTRNNARDTQVAFFNATFAIMGHLAKMDGRVSRNELNIARGIMAKLELDAQQRLSAMHLFNRGKQATFDINTVLVPLRQECGGYYDLLRFFIQVLLDTALVDGPLSAKQYQCILLICTKLNCAPGDFPRLRLYQQQNRQQKTAPRKNDLQLAFETLGISSDSVKADIKIAYRRLMNMHHPDKLASKGLPAEMMRLAKEKTQEVRAAYDLVRQHRRFK